MISKHNESKKMTPLIDEIELKEITDKKDEDKIQEKSPLPVDIIKLANTPKNYVIHRTLKQRLAIEDKLKLDEKSNHKPINILCFGCHGNLDLKARLVAEQLAQAVEKDQILFIIVTGDNIYPKGVSSPFDKKFISYFYDKYLNKFPALKKKCFFIALGNHDHNLRNYIGVNPDEGIAVAANEVAHTYLNESQEFDPEKLKYLSQKYIDLETLNENYHWMMPSRFYALHHQESNTEFFFLDSNTYLHEYSELQKLNTQIENVKQKIEFAENEIKKINESKEMEGDYKKYILQIYETLISTNKETIEKLLADRESNQAYWFKKSYQMHPETRKIIIQHHPLYTVGKRAKESDANLYLTDQEIAELKSSFRVEKGCDLIVMSSLDKKQDLHRLPGYSKTAYILTGEDRFYHIDKIKDECVEIKINNLTLKKIKDKLELKDIPRKSEHRSRHDKIVSLEELTFISSVTAHKPKKIFHANYNDMLKMAFKKEGILPGIDVVIHSHDHGTSLFYDSEFKENGELIKKSFCQLTVGGGGGEFQEMKEFSEIRKIPVYCGFGSCTMTLLDDEIRFRLNTVKSPDLEDWHSQGKSWYFSNKSPAPLFDWNNIASQSEKTLYLLIRHLILQGCYHYYDSFDQSKSGQNKFFRSIDSMTGNFGSVGLSRALNIIGVINNPTPESTLSILKEVYTLLKGSTILLDKINHQFKDKTFKVIATQFTVRNFVDFVIKYEAIIQQYHKMSDAQGEASLFKSKKPEELYKDPMSFKLVPF